MIYKDLTLNSCDETQFCFLVIIVHSIYGTLYAENKFKHHV